MRRTEKLRYIRSRSTISTWTQPRSRWQILHDLLRQLLTSPMPSDLALLQYSTLRSKHGEPFPRAPKRCPACHGGSIYQAAPGKPRSAPALRLTQITPRCTSPGMTLKHIAAGQVASSQPKLSGNMPRAGDLPGADTRGAMSSYQMANIAVTFFKDAFPSTTPLTTGILRPHRPRHFSPMGTGYTRWQEMCGNGAPTGLVQNIMHTVQP